MNPVVLKLYSVLLNGCCVFFLVLFLLGNYQFLFVVIE